MKRRMILLLLCIAMALALVPAAGEEAEGDYTYYPESEEYVGIWVSGDYTLEISHMEADRALFRCVVTRRGPDAATGERWVYDGCSYDDVGEALASVEIGVKSEVVFDESGEPVTSEQIFDDGAAGFALSADGTMVWTDLKVTPGENEIAFARAGEAGQADGLHAAIQPETDSPDWVANLPAAQDEGTQQLFVVACMGFDRTTATISMHQRSEDGSWKQILSTPGYVGKNGLCADADHAEGCGQTPLGTYRFNRAFGIAADPGCAIPYIQVDGNIYWSGDPDREYNRMVDIRDVPELAMDDSEHIVDYEYEYQYCLNISFNEDGTPGRGSAIFLHCLGRAKPYTGGCVAIPEYIMKHVMQNVRPDCVVVIDTFENMGGSF